MGHWGFEVKYKKTMTTHSTIKEIKTTDSLQNIEITPVELRELIANKANIILLDVRTQKEIEIASLGGVHIPLNELSTRVDELDQESRIIIYCHHGVRSLAALNILQDSGFNRMQHLKGGIDSWSDIVDSSIRKY